MVKKWNIGHLVLNIDPNTGLFVVGVKGSNEGLELTREEVVELRKFLDDINATDTKMNGRLNEETILLRIG